MPSPPPVASLREAYRARKTFLVGCDGIGFAGRDLRSGASPYRALFRRWRPLALIYSGLHSALCRSGASSGLAGVSLICEMGKGVKIRWCRAVPENRLPSSSGPAAPAGGLRGPSQPRRPPLCARRAAHRTPAALALSGGRLDSTRLAAKFGRPSRWRLGNRRRLRHREAGGGALRGGEDEGGGIHVNMMTRAGRHPRHGVALQAAGRAGLTAH